MLACVRSYARSVVDDDAPHVLLPDAGSGANFWYRAPELLTCAVCRLRGFGCGRPRCCIFPMFAATIRIES
jgi:hypothetical protein